MMSTLGAAGLLCFSSAAWLAERDAHAATEVRLGAKEFVFVPGEAEAPPGDATLVVRNEGAIEHNFILEDAAKKKVAEIAVIEAGQTLQVKAALRAGTYTFYCSLPGHREAGMAGVLRVK